MDVVVLVPRRPEPWRDRLWEFVRERVEANIGWPIVEGVDEGEEPMNRAAARNQAAEQAGGWDVAVFLDADTIPDFDNLRGAAELAGDGHLVCAQDRLHSIDRKGTERVLAGEIELQEAPLRWTYPNPKSSCIAIGRDLWDAVGGYDERFEGWGWEDSSIYHACQAIGGVERIDGGCWHLWHLKSKEKDSALTAYQANAELGARYKAARHNTEEMWALLAEPGGPLDGFHRGGEIEEMPPLASGGTR